MEVCSDLSRHLSQFLFSNSLCARRPQSAANASPQLQEETENLLRLRVAVTANGHREVDGPTLGFHEEPAVRRVQLSPRGRSTHVSHGASKEGGRRMILTPRGSQREEEGDTQDPAKMPMPDAVAYALAREELLKKGMELEVGRAYTRCQVCCANN